MFQGFTLLAFVTPGPDLVEQLLKPDVLLLDVRTREEYLGFWFHCYIDKEDTPQNLI